MHQTKKGNNRHFGMKMHIGVDDGVGLIHRVETVSAKVHDIAAAADLLHGKEICAWGDAGYLGIDKREAHANSDIRWFVSCRPGKRKQMAAGSAESALEKIKAQVRAGTQGIQQSLRCGGE